MASNFGDGSNFGSAAINTGANFGHSSQFGRHPPPVTPSFCNAFNQPTLDVGVNRFPPVFQPKCLPTRHPTTSSASTASSSCAATPSPPPAAANHFDCSQSTSVGGSVVSDVGTIVWLSSDRGLIEKVLHNDTCGEVPVRERTSKSPGANSDDNNNSSSSKSKPSSPVNNNVVWQIAFGIKEFCDQAVTDLSSVLRVGFLVKFHAIADPMSISHGSGAKFQRRMNATFVSFVSLPDWRTPSQYIVEAAKKLSLHLDATPVESAVCDVISRRKIPFNVEMELRATNLLMDIYRELAAEGPQCPLNTFHCIVSNCGDDQMYRYIGTSSQKRREFVDQRKHFFAMTSDDTVCLVPAAMYTVVMALCRELLQRGGSMKVQELFTQYLSWPDLPLEARELIGETIFEFMQFLQSHSFLFSIFPSRVFVSLQRRLPDFDYGAFLEECFGDQEGSPLYSQCKMANNVSVGDSTQQHAPPLHFNDTRSAPFGANGAAHSQNPMANHLVSPPLFKHPTPPIYPLPGFPRLNRPTNYQPFNVPPPPVGYRNDLSSNSVGQWPLASGSNRTSNFDGTPIASMSGSSGGGSSHSLSSGYFTGTVPSTPAIAQSQEFWPGGNGQGSAQAPEHVAGFWKSYELGTESLIRQLTMTGGARQHRAADGLRSTPTPSSLCSQEFGATSAVGGPHGNRMVATPDSASIGQSAIGAPAMWCRALTSDGTSQTDRVVLPRRCGQCGADNEWHLPPLETALADMSLSATVKPELVDAGIQTDAIEPSGVENLEWDRLEKLSV